MKKTKIVCTLGPSSRDENILREMLLAGMNGARLNFSHGNHEYHAETIAMFRKVRDGLNLPAAVMLDTRGPEIRTGKFACPVVLKEGQKFTLTTNETPGTEELCYITYADLPRQIKAGDCVLIDDGKVKLHVDGMAETEIYCTVADGGAVSSHKGVNVPEIPLDMTYISQKDKDDLLFGIEQDVDFVAASFTRREEDIIALRSFLDINGGCKIKIIAKIENQEGVKNFRSILNRADGIMVARGDMGVEIPYELLPGIQKRFIKECYQSGKIVITATQLLESMIESRRPTRAEITDVANAVFDGTSAVMLSAETAAGKYPVEAVRTMVKIAEQAEKDAFETNMYKDMGHSHDIKDITNAISAAACTTADQMNAKAIIADTTTGTAARRVSKYRPTQIIVAATPLVKTYHQLSMSWGVYPVLIPNDIDDVNALFTAAIDCAKEKGFIAPGDSVVLTAGVPLKVRGNTNMLKAQIVK